MTSKSSVRVSPKDVTPRLCCEWQMCDAVYDEMESFMDHIECHLQDLLETIKMKDGQLCQIGAVRCEWRECGHEMERDFVELVRHVYFHAFHAKIKNIGEHIIKVRDQQCLLDRMSRNMIPELPDRLQCAWSDCQRIYDNPERFYQHVSCHPDVYGEGNNLPEGAKCDWEGCGFLVRSKHKLREHLRSHTQEKLVACPNCGSLFSNNTKFSDHLTRQREALQQSYQCSHCRKKFSSERLLRDHMRHHVNHYKCPMCDMTCPCPSTLRRHMLHRHSKERPYACTHCKAKFVMQSDLRRHEESHSFSRYQCHVADCKYFCHNYPSLSNHFKKVHQGMTLSRYECHVCEKKFSRGAKLTAHLKKKHNFKWPSGHRRFRYKEMDDGMFRLQTIRYESIELTEQILTDKLHKGGRPPAEKTRDKEQAEKPAADWSYNLEMLGEVALKVPKAARKDSIQRKDFIPIQFGSTEDNVMKVEDNNNNEDEEESYEDASLDEESNSPPEEMDTSEYSEPGPSSSWKISSPEPPSALQNLAFRGFYNENSSSLSSIDSFSSAGVGSTCDETSKENFQPVSEENGDFKEIQVEIVTGSGSVAVVSGMPSSLIIDPTTGMVEYPATEN